MYKSKCAKFCVSKPHFMKPDLNFEMMQEIIQKYDKNVVSVSERITEPKLFRFQSRFRSFTNDDKKIACIWIFRLD